MCGILGSVGVDTNPTEFENVLSRLSHRGPDGFGIWKNAEPNIWFGHRRLSIIDLTDGGKQPKQIGDYVITFNGEIYNYLEVKDLLIQKGYSFKTDSDSEVLLTAYIEWGEKCLSKFNGMWSLAIFDKRKNQIFFSRDRFGKKPLFYHQNGNSIVFASEMKAIIPFMKEVKPTKDFNWMVKYHFEYETTEKCLVDGIKRFPAGSYGYYDLDTGQIKINKYWHLLDQLVDVPKTYDEQVEKLKELFLDSVKLRMRSDVSIGTALSGGFDSSAAICTMNYIGKNTSDLKTTSDWQHAYVASFPKSFLDETEYAKQVVEYLRIKGTYFPIDPKEGIENLSELLYYFEEIDATSPIPMSKVYKGISEDGVRVSMDGHGVDESYSGYGKSIFEAFLDTNNLSEIRNILNTYRSLHPSEFTSNDSTSDLLIYLKYLAKRKKTVLRNLINKVPILQKSIQDGPIDKLGNFNYNLYLLFNQSILPTLLRNYDRYSMMNSVEIRMPFMDHRLVSYAFSLPWKSKLNGGYTKKILRDALSEFMPKEIAWRKQKIGFQTPLLEYFKGPWKEYFEDIINSNEFKTCVLTDTNHSQSLFIKIQTSSTASSNDARAFWLSVMPYLWQESFLKKSIQN